MATSAASALNPYELLGVASDARDDVINKAFRQKSLKVHPDRNPDNPEAAQKFHELKQAQELLLDPLRRAEIDASVKKRQQHAEQYAKADAKRKRFMDELDASERSFKKAKSMSAVEKRKKEEKEEALKEQGRRMREEREGRHAATHKETNEAEFLEPEEPNMTPSFDPQDAPVRIKYNLMKRPDLSSQEALLGLLTPFGPIDESCVIFTLKTPKDKPNAPPKFATAIIMFKRVEDAFGVVGATGQESRGLKNVDISWAKGEEPESIKELRQRGLLGTGARPSVTRKEGSEPRNKGFPSASAGLHASASTSASTFPSSQGSDTMRSARNVALGYDSKSAADFESVTLMRMRQAERDRLAREIEEAESREEAS